jgi:threonine efflux protein
MNVIERPPLCWLRAFDALQMFAAAFWGFLLAHATLSFAAACPRSGSSSSPTAVTRVVGVIFILFGTRSIADAPGRAMRRAA